MKDTLHDRMTNICPHCKEYDSVCDHLFVLTNQCQFIKNKNERRAMDINSLGIIAETLYQLRQVDAKIKELKDQEEKSFTRPYAVTRAPKESAIEELKKASEDAESCVNRLEKFLKTYHVSAGGEKNDDRK
jgi:hypothetical protein